MAYVNHVKSKNLRDSISDSKNNANKLYYPTDSEAVVMNGKKYGVPNITGKINLSSIDEVKAAQNLLNQTNEVAFYLVTDSSGKIPSSQSCYNIPSDIVKQLSLTSPNSVTNGVLALATSSTTLDAVGVNVGDLIALTRVKVKVSDLTAALGINLSLSGEIEIYQYKILSMNDAKPAGHSQASAGVMGLMSPWDKGQVNKISGIESTANNALPKTDRLPTNAGNEFNMDECLQNGIYPWCATGKPSGSIGHYSLIVHRSSTADFNGFYTINQLAFGREGDTGKVFTRIIFAKDDGTKEFGQWIPIKQTMSESDKTDFDAIRTWYNSVVGTDSDEVINKWGEIVAFLNNIPEGDTLDGIITALNTGLDNLEEKHTQEINAVNEEIDEIKNGTTKVNKAYVADNVGDLSAEDIQSFIDDSTELLEGIPNTYAKKGEALRSAGITVSQGTDKATIILEGQYADGTAFNPSASGVVIPAATTSKAGLMSNSDKLKVGRFKKEYYASGNNTYYKIASIKITSANFKHPQSFFVQGSASTIQPALVTVRFRNTSLANTNVKNFEYIGSTQVGSYLSILQMEDTTTDDGTVTAKNFEIWAEKNEWWAAYRTYPLTQNSAITFHEGALTDTLPTAIATTACSLGSWDSNIPLVTASANGLMSSDMLKKIDNIQMVSNDDVPVIQMLQEDASHQVLIPYMQNDIAYPIARGGYIKVVVDGVERTDVTDAICNGTPDPISISSLTPLTSVVTIEIDNKRTLMHAEYFYLAIGASWCIPKNIKVEVKLNETDDWTTIGETTDNTKACYAVKYYKNVEHTRYIRYTITNINANQLRVSDIGVASYISKGLQNIVLPLGGGEMYGPIYPYKDVAYDLGAGSKRWKAIYAENFQGTASRATADGSGKNIAETYATKTALNNYLPSTLANRGFIQLFAESGKLQHVIPQMQNDLAYLIERGGSVQFYKNGSPMTISSTEQKKIFNCIQNYLVINKTELSATDTLVVDVDFDGIDTVAHGAYGYVWMYNSYRADDIKVEMYYPSLDKWGVAYNVTDAGKDLHVFYFVSTKDADGNTIASSTAATKMRITFENFKSTHASTMFRLLGVGIIKYAGKNSSAICLPRNGGDIYGGINPFNSNSYDLGSSSKKWKTVYAGTFQGKATVAADVDVANNVATSGDRPLVWTGGTVGNSSNSGASDLYKSYGDLSYNPSKKRLTTGLFKGVLESVSVPSSQTYLLQYYAGQATLGDAAGNAKEGSHADPNLWSYPEGGTHGDTNANRTNIQTLRFKWSNDYFHDLYMSPNRKYLWHRRVQDGNAYPWKKIVESDADGNVVLDGSLTVNGNYNVKTEIEKKSTVIDVKALFTFNGTIAGLTQDMLCKATLYAQGTEGDGSIPVRFYPSGILRDGIATNPSTGYLVAEAISQTGSSISVDKRIATITIDSTGAKCTGVETRYGEL